MLVGAIQGIRTRLLKVGAKRNGVTCRAIRRENDLQFRAGSQHRRSIKRSGRAARTINNARIPVKVIARNGDGTAKDLRRRRTNQRGVCRHGKPANRNVGCQIIANNLVVPNRNRRLTKQVQLGRGDGVGRACKSVAGSY